MSLEEYNPTEELTNQALEAGLLLGLIEAPEHLQSIGLLPEIFSKPDYRVIYEALVSGLSPDTTALIDAEIPSDLLSAGQTLAELADKRTLDFIIRVCRKDLKTDKSFDEIKALLEASIIQLSQGRGLAAIKKSIPGASPEMRADYLNRQTRREELGNAGLNTHIPGLNRLLGGLQPGIHILAAPPGTGKTTFTLQLACHIATEGYPVVFVSFEESTNRLTMKAYCQQAGLDLKAYTDGRGDLESLDTAIEKYGPKLERLWIIENQPGLSVARVKAEIMQAMKATNQKHGLIIVDYLQVWAATQRGNKSDAFRHDVSALVSDLRRVSLDLGIPILAISSQSRGSYAGNTTSDDLSSLKESGELEYTADTAWFLIKRDVPGISPRAKALTLSVQKNRFGETGKVSLLFDLNKGIIREDASKQ